jgi:sulfhydrogenase subunit alpha
MIMEKDMKDMVEAIADRPTDEIKRWCELMIRAYDPCFSCSVH